MYGSAYWIEEIIVAETRILRWTMYGVVIRLEDRIGNNDSIREAVLEIMGKMRMNRLKRFNGHDREECKNEIRVVEENLGRTKQKGGWIRG